MKQRTLALVVGVAVVLSSLITWIASAKIQSPAEVAARTAPPTATPLLVKVEKRVLTTKVVSRGTGHYGSPQDLSLTSSALKSGPRIITTLPDEGDVMAEGAVLMTVSGRPVFLLDGAQPSYRDLGPGISGADVLQLEKALRRLGHSPGPVDGTFDAATGTAVTRLYQARGYSPVVATDAQLASARPREASLVKGSRAQAGVQLPADEVVYVAATPLRVAKVGGELGAAPKDAPVTVTNSIVSVDGSLPVEQAGLFQVGAPVDLDEPALGIKAKGKVSRIASQPGTNGLDGYHVFFQVVVADPPPALVGASVRLTVPVKSTSTAQLTVPVSAVTLGSDGGSRVERSVAGRVESVTVEPGLSSEGYVAITVLEGALGVGDLVVVGIDGNEQKRD